MIDKIAPDLLRGRLAASVDLIDMFVAHAVDDIQTVLSITTMTADKPGDTCAPYLESVVHIWDTTKRGDKCDIVCPQHVHCHRCIQILVSDLSACHVDSLYVMRYHR